MSIETPRDLSRIYHSPHFRTSAQPIETHSTQLPITVAAAMLILVCAFMGYAVYFLATHPWLLDV